MRSAKRRLYRVNPYPLYNAARGAYRVFTGAKKAWNFISGKKKTTAGNGVTQQFDMKTQYRKKYMPKKKKRAWRRFLKKNLAADMANIGTRSVIRNNQLDVTVGPTNQIYAAVSLFGRNGGSSTTDQCGSDDIQKVCSGDTEINGANEKVYFGSGVLDVTGRNVGNTQLEVDVYLIKYWGNADDHTATPIADVIAAQTQTPAIPGGSGTSLQLSDRGATPFQFPLLGKMGWRIISKKKYLVGSLQQFTYQIRDPRNYGYSQVGYNMGVSGSFVQVNKTQTLLFVIKNAVGTLENGRMVFGCTRTYSYKVIHDNEDFDAIV